MKDLPQLGDRVIVTQFIGLIYKLNKTHAQIIFDNNKIGTFPLKMISIRNDLIRNKTGGYDNLT